MKGLFITGTDTGVGKTVASAALLLRYQRIIALRYWKPIQTGMEEDDDTATVRFLAGCEVFAQGIRLPKPVSPHLAARWAGTPIDVDALVGSLPGGNNAWLVEGAGGVLVPVNETHMIADLISRLGLAVVVVARSGLGTINHTLLTLEALRARALPIAGVLLAGDLHPDNRAAIEHYGRVKVVGELPVAKPLTPDSLAILARQLDPDGSLLEFLR